MIYVLVAILLLWVVFTFVGFALKGLVGLVSVSVIFAIAILLIGLERRIRGKGDGPLRRRRRR